ncbi:MAG TPA: aminoglycoside 6-adenylyltransferase [Anaerolineales bacterium]|nr:aminoglycoside 6-adenylyltransferase [Anaerolineales bacterium]
MIGTDAWQEQTAEELRAMLVSNEDVLAFALFGSASLTNQFDLWSDLDCLLVVQDKAYPQFYPTMGWLRAFGELYAFHQSENAFHGTTRVCFTDFTRLDIVITTESKINRLAEWQSIPFWQGIRPLFSRSSQITRLLSQTRPSPKPTFPSQLEFDQMVNHFWFKAMLASYKVIRHDRLIALHLALDLVRDCCVIGMMLRDRAEGTNIHREGGMGNNIVAQLERTCADYTVIGILDIIEQSSIQFDQFAAQWSDEYQERRYPLIEWLEHIRGRLNVG